MHVPLTTRDFIERAALAFGSKTAIVDEPGVAGGFGSLTYAELPRDRAASRRRSTASGSAPGARIAIVSPNCARFMVALFGATTTGRILVPVNFRLKPHEVSFIVEHSGAELLLVDPELDEALGELPVKRRVVLDGVADADTVPGGRRAGAVGAGRERGRDDQLHVGHDVGPKGVMLTHRSLWLNAVTFGWHIGLSDRDVYLHTLPQFHVNGWGMPLATTAMGMEQVILRKIDGEEILQRIERHGVTVFCAAPTVISAVLDAAAARSERGEPLPGAGTVRAVVAGVAAAVGGRSSASRSCSAGSSTRSTG